MSAKASSFKFRWERALNATRYVASVKQVGRVLAGYANADGTNARPGIERLMSDCSLERSAVQKALRVLIEDGWTTKATRSGMKRDYFDSHTLLWPSWLDDLAPGRPDCRREFDRAVHASKLKAARDAKRSAANQVHTYGPDTKIDLVDDAARLGVYANPDQVYTYTRLGVYETQNVAGQTTPLPTTTPSSTTNHGAPSVAGSPRSPHAALPHVPHGVELADARSVTHVPDPAESTGPVAVPYKAHRVEAFRNESDAYVAAAKKLAPEAIADILKNWRREREGEYKWARPRAIARMGRASEAELKSARGFERADRLTLENALRMHLEDGSWDKTLLEPLGVPELPLTPLAVNGLGSAQRKSALRDAFDAIRRMDHEGIMAFGLRFKAEEPGLFDAAVEAAKADIAKRPDLGSSQDRLNRLACMQIMNTTKDWPEWMTKTLNAVDAA